MVEDGSLHHHLDTLDMYPRLRTSRHARRQAGDQREDRVIRTCKNRRQRTWGVCVAESAMAPPSPIPNLVVPHGSAGEYCTGNRVGGEAAAHTPQLRCLISDTLLAGNSSLTTAGWSSGSSLGS
jgi:hypothetical protein